jgi:hypothetical protein
MFRKINPRAITLVELTEYSVRITSTARSALLSAALLAPGLAMAGGGLDSATEGANTFKVWLYSFLGVCASCVLLWKGAECWADRSHWSEFVTLGGKVAVVGAVVGVLAPYLWNLFT